jgi:hypothetical protein
VARVLNVSYFPVSLNKRTNRFFELESNTMRKVHFTSNSLKTIAIVLMTVCLVGCSEEASHNVVKKPKIASDAQAPHIDRDSSHETSLKQTPPEKIKKPRMSFKQKSIEEMETIFNEPIKIHQDAINAAYIKIGWEYGKYPTNQQDILAFKQGLAWGFAIAKLTRKGRKSTFTSEDIANHPLETRVAFSSSVPKNRSVAQKPVSLINNTQPEPTASISPIASTEKPSSLAQPKPIDTEESTRLDDELTQLERNVSSIQKQIEQHLRSYKNHPHDFRKKISEIKQAIIDLDHQLTQSESQLANKDQMIHSRIQENVVK